MSGTKQELNEYVREKLKYRRHLWSAATAAAIVIPVVLLWQILQPDTFWARFATILLGLALSGVSALICLVSIKEATDRIKDEGYRREIVNGSSADAQCWIGEKQNNCCGDNDSDNST